MKWKGWDVVDDFRDVPAGGRLEVGGVRYSSYNKDMDGRLQGIFLEDQSRTVRTLRSQVQKSGIDTDGGRSWSTRSDYQVKHRGWRNLFGLLDD